MTFYSSQWKILGTYPWKSGTGHLWFKNLARVIEVTWENRIECNCYDLNSPAKCLLRELIFQTFLRAFLHMNLEQNPFFYYARLKPYRNDRHVSVMAIGRVLCCSFIVNALCLCFLFCSSFSSLNTKLTWSCINRYRFVGVTNAEEALFY